RREHKIPDALHQSRPCAGIRLERVDAGALWARPGGRAVHAGRTFWRGPGRRTGSCDSRGPRPGYAGDGHGHSAEARNESKRRVAWHEAAAPAGVHRSAEGGGGKREPGIRRAAVFCGSQGSNVGFPRETAAQLRHAYRGRIIAHTKYVGEIAMTMLQAEK